MPWPFDRTYMQLALAGGMVIGACAPLIGVFLVQRRTSLMGDGIGHVAFAGVAAGMLTGVRPLWTALGVSVAAALGMEWFRRRGRATADLALALMFYSGIAGGVVLAGLAGALDATLFSYLFGSILTVDAQELAAIVVLGLGVVAWVAVAGRSLFALVIDEEWAAVAGIKVGPLNASLAMASAVTIVAAMRIVGLLLVAALMVLPVASAQLVARSFRSTVVWSSAFGVTSVVLGLAAARTWGLAPGGTIVLMAAGTFAVLSVAGGRARRTRHRLAGLQPRPPAEVDV